MIIFLASWAMLFAALFFVYGGIRARANVWPPPDQIALPLGLPAWNTAVIAITSMLLHWALVSIRRGRSTPRGAAFFIGASTLLGVVFLALQFVVWRDVFRAGLTPDSGPYASAFYALTCLHALHVLVGLFALAGLTIMAGRGAFTPARHVTLRLWAMYWHFVGIVWLIMFLSVYVL